MNRNQAIIQGLHKYEADKPCRKGHAPLRYTHTGTCVQCIKGYRADYLAKGAELTRRRREDPFMLPPLPHGQEYHELGFWPADLPAVAAFVAALNTARQIEYNARVAETIDMQRRRPLPIDAVPPPIRQILEGT
jgi:hypothetical protein